jgi:hypothetical protein
LFLDIRTIYGIPRPPLTITLLVTNTITIHAVVRVVMGKNLLVPEYEFLETEGVESLS